MKKALSSVLAILLTLAMLGMFAACKEKPADLTEPESTTEAEVITTEPDTEVIEETTAPDETTDDETTPVDAPEVTTVEETTVSNNKFAPPENLGSLSAADQLAYFNLVTGRVRTEKPGYDRTSQLKIQDMNFTGIVSAAQGIINNVVTDLMPGDLETNVMAKGKDNKTDFMSVNANPTELRAQDINSIKSTKSGDNWVIEVKVKDSTDPAKGTGSTVGRIADMQTKQEIFDAIVESSGGVISADINNATVKYHTIYASVTVNADGQVIEGKNGFDVAASANGVKMISIIKTDAKFVQTSRWTYKNFKW